MRKAPATYRNGQVVFDVPVDWPNGTRVVVFPGVDDYGLDESEWPETSEQGPGALVSSSAQ